MQVQRDKLVPVRSDEAKGWASPWTNFTEPALTQRSLSRRAHEFPSIIQIAIHPAGYFIVSATSDSLKIWDSSGNLLRTLPYTNSPLSALAFDATGREIFLFFPNGIQIWDIATGAVRVRLIGANCFVIPPEKPPLALRIARSSNSIWDIAADECRHKLQGMDSPLKRAAFSPHGDCLIAIDIADVLYVWDPQTGELRARWPAKHYSPSHRPIMELLIIGQRKLFLWTTPGAFHAWDCERGERAWSFDGPTPRLSTPIVHANGERAIFRGQDGSVEAWDLVRGQKIRSWSQLGNHDLIGTWLADGRRFVLRDGDRTGFVIVDIEDPADPLLPTQRHKSHIHWLISHPDGQRVVSATENEPFVLWDIKSRSPIARFGEVHPGISLEGDDVSSLAVCIAQLLARLDELLSTTTNIVKLDPARGPMDAEIRWIRSFRDHVSKFDVSTNADPRDVLHSLYVLTRDWMAQETVFSPKSVRRILEDIWSDMAQALSGSAALVPRPGKPELLGERLLEYIAPHDPQWCSRTRPSSQRQIRQYAVLAGLGDSINVLPPSYLAFLEAMGDDCGGLFGAHTKFLFVTNLDGLRDYYRGCQFCEPEALNSKLPVVANFITLDQLSLDLRNGQSNPEVVETSQGDYCGSFASSWENLVMNAAMEFVESRRLPLNRWISRAGMHRRPIEQDKRDLQAFVAAWGGVLAWPSDAYRSIYISPVLSLFADHHANGALLVVAYSSDAKILDRFDKELGAILHTTASGVKTKNKMSRTVDDGD